MDNKKERQQMFNKQYYEEHRELIRERRMQAKNDPEKVERRKEITRKYRENKKLKEQSSDSD